MALPFNNVSSLKANTSVNPILYGFSWILLSVSLSVYTGFIPGLQALLAFFCLLLAPLIRPKLTYVALGLSFAVMYGIIITLASPIFDKEINALNADALLRCRYWVFQLCFALLGIALIKSITSIHGLIRARRWSAVMLSFFSLVSIIQVVFFSQEQASIFSAEPSQSASVLLFWMLLSTGLFWMTTGKINNFIVATGLIGVLATGSKAGYITASFFLLTIVRPRYLFSLVSVGLILALGQFLLPDVLGPLNKIFYLASVLSEVGLDGLSYEYQIWDSWIVRLGSFGSAVLMMFDYPMGVGFGGFAFYLPDYINNIIPVNTSLELTDILAGNSYATPKSYGMEFLVSTGFVGFLLIIISLIIIIRRCGLAIPTICYLCLLAQSFAVELAPFLAMLVIIYSSGLSYRNISHVYPEV